METSLFDQLHIVHFPNNRYKCSRCNATIPQNTHALRIHKQSYRTSTTYNICVQCLFNIVKVIKEKEMAYGN